MNILLNDVFDESLTAKVMIVDDQSTSRLIMETIVQGISGDIKIKSFDNAIDALHLTTSEPPDLIIVDYKMTSIDGIEFIRRLKQTTEYIDIPVIMVTAVEDKAILYEALEAGATDFLTKPVDHYECKVRCRNLLIMRQQQLIIKNRAKWLENEVNKAVNEIQIREKETLYRLARAGEFKDQDTGQHLKRISFISYQIAEYLGLDERICKTIEIAAPMHDIGKIGIPDKILLKAGKLDYEEFEIMKTHTIIGHEILKSSPSPYLQMGAIIALNHHEKYSGNGYPNRLKGEEIPIEARIVATADVFDALTTKRQYKNAWSIESTLEYLHRESGDHFDPCCVNAIDSRLDAISNLRKTNCSIFD